MVEFGLRQRVTPGRHQNCECARGCEGLGERIESRPDGEGRGEQEPRQAAGDEGDEYAVRVRDYSELLGVGTVFCSDIVGETRGTLPDGRKIYTLADVYPKADLVTYPSTLEGFGNAFLEAVYFRVPILVNNYSIYHSDIKPKGFSVIEIKGFVTNQTVNQTRRVLDDAVYREKMVNHNYEIALRYFSYSVLHQKLKTLIMDCLGYPF